jgi:hypothetical protein
MKHRYMADSKAEQPQIDKFRDLARELECDDDEAAFDERLGQIVPKPKPQDPGDKGD